MTLKGHVILFQHIRGHLVQYGLCVYRCVLNDGDCDWDKDCGPNLKCGDDNCNANHWRHDNLLEVSWYGYVSN